MSKIKVTTTEKNRLYIDPDTKIEFPSDHVVETEETWFVKAKIKMGHFKVVEEDKSEPVEESPAEEGAPEENTPEPEGDEVEEKVPEQSKSSPRKKAANAGEQ